MWGGGHPPVPGPDIQMVPFTKLLLPAPCPSLILPGPFSETGGKEAALEGPPQLLSGSLGGLGSRVSAGCGGVDPSLSSLAGAAGLGPASALEASAQAAHVAWVPSPGVAG